MVAALRSVQSGCERVEVGDATSSGRISRFPGSSGIPRQFEPFDFCPRSILSSGRSEAWAPNTRLCDPAVLRQEPFPAFDADSCFSWRGASRRHADACPGRLIVRGVFACLEVVPGVGGHEVECRVQDSRSLRAAVKLPSIGRRWSGSSRTRPSVCAPPATVM